MNSRTRHLTIHPSSNPEVEPASLPTQKVGTSTKHHNTATDDTPRADENVPSYPRIESLLGIAEPEPFSTASMKFLNHNKKAQKKSLVLKTHKIQVSSSTQLSSSNIASPADLGKIDLGVSPQKMFRDRDMSAAGSQTWSMTEGDGNNPFSTPAKQKLLGTKWFPEAITDEDESGRAWKKANIRNKIGTFNADDKDIGDDNISDDGLESEEDSAIEEEKDEEGSLRVEDVENAAYDNIGGNHRRPSRRSRPPTLLRPNEQARSRRNTGHIEININQPDQAGEERRSSVPRNGSRNSSVNRGIRRASQAQNVIGQRQYEPYAELEAKLYLKRSLAFFIALTLASMLAVLSIDQNWSYMNPVYIIYVYLVYYGVESIVRSCCITRENWKQREDGMNVFDAIGGILFLAAVQLKLSNTISISMIAALPFGATIIGYLAVSSAPKTVTVKKCVIRIFFAFQVFFITAKLDKFINFNWEIIFSFSWLFLGIMGLYLVSYGMIFILALLFSIFKQRLFEDLRLHVQIIGLFWYVMFYSLSAIIFTALIGAAKATHADGNLELLRYSMMGSLIANTTLTALTLVAFKPLTKFMEAFNNSSPNNGSTVVAQDNQNRRGQVNLEVVKKESYFVMLSSTYFLPMDKNFFAKNEQKLKKIKDILTNFSLWKSKRYEDNQEDEPVGVNVLKGYKETLDKQFTKLAGLKHDNSATSKGFRSTKAKNPTVKANFLRRKVEEDDISPGGPDTLRSNQRLHLSADDINIKDMSPSSEATKPGEDNLCYLCYSNPPNAVLMRCGHGGICYECASTLVKKKNECMQCRSPVEAIYKVDPNPKLSDIIKGVELSKVNLS